MNIDPIFEKVERIERNLQELKINLFLNLPKERKGGEYKEEEIVKEVRRIRKKLWSKTYAKAVKSLS